MRFMSDVINLTTSTDGSLGAIGTILTSHLNVVRRSKSVCYESQAKSIFLIFDKEM